MISVLDLQGDYLRPQPLVHETVGHLHRLSQDWLEERVGRGEVVLERRLAAETLRRRADDDGPLVDSPRKLARYRAPTPKQLLERANVRAREVPNGLQTRRAKLHPRLGTHSPHALERKRSEKLGGAIVRDHGQSVGLVEIAGDLGNELVRRDTSRPGQPDLRADVLLDAAGDLLPVPKEGPAAGHIKKRVLEISQEALDKLKQMRATEGGYLEADIQKCCTAIDDDLKQIRGRGSIIMQEYAEKLKKRVNELIAHAEHKIDEGILAREVAIFADRSDISEEVSRLDSHLQQFEQCCNGNDQAGRRLDFISQEMLREANTIASKASDTETTRYVVNIKCQIDRIKEQVQNIE